MASKKPAKPKIISEDISEYLNQSEMLKDSPKPKKTQKRGRNEQFEEEDISKLIGQYQASAKKKKVEGNIGATKESCQKILHLVGQQLEARKSCNHHLMTGLSEITSQIESDYNSMKDNEQKLEQLTGTYMKCIQQATNAYKHKLKALKEIQVSFKKHVEGLLMRGAMKPDDRPLWFDVYRAFPPKEEPKFARPKPEIKPIRQILYKEDAVRAQFHSKGHGFAAINLMSPGDTQIKKLVQQYDKLKSDGVSEEEIIEKSVAAVGLEIKEHRESQKSVNEQKPVNEKPSKFSSVSKQVLTDANIAEIFKEDK